MQRLTWPEVHARRLARHHLTPPGAPRPGPHFADVARAICGVHAQVMSAAELSLALRVPGTTRTDVREALWRDRTVVKTFGPRGTVHLLAADDLPVWTSALAAVPSPNRFPDGVRLDDAQTDEVVTAIGDALDGVALTIDELSDAVVARTGPWAGELTMPAFGGMWPRWRQVLHRAGHRGVLAFGPNRGQKVTYVNPRVVPADPDRALDQVLRRYLTSYGPARPEHFAQWLAAPKPWAAALFAAADLERVDVEGVEGWVLAGDTAPASGSSVRLLPYFDAYQVGCHPRDQVFPGRAWERALARTQAGNHPVVVVDGVVAGVWHVRRSGRRLAITVEQFGPVHRAALEREVERVGVILEGTPALTLGPVTIGPHA
ncbi:winged helix DNA-binding domain-containing protein [Cryptosporangium arvum]|uniref:winged helix DNA-binding domain-containing protein n=1 Tax=Cryptosporangium arvum TaxID=80871 RepID=UPI0004AFC118|nr:winged helix DNA-binding domain-containing protein [Cryptosporangium arvum]